MVNIPPNTPVIVGVGESIDRPEQLRGLEPARLMADAVRAAERDAGAPLLDRIDSLDTINEVSWPYDDAAGVVARMLGIQPRRTGNSPVGGESPVRYLHQAALRIQSGEITCATICGGEAEYSARKAARAGLSLDWSPRSSNPKALRAGDRQRSAVRALEAALPINVYPLYENAARARWGQSFAEAHEESALIWSNMSRVAAARSFGWQRRPFTADEIATPGPDNRLISWPYTKLMIANPLVNLGACIIVTSYQLAIELGVAPGNMIHILGGHAANEPDDLLQRRDFASADAMRHVLEQAMGYLEGSAPDLFELYSCFPVVPKMARRVLDLPHDAALTVTGGLTFFGAPLNNYMGHAIVAMVQKLRLRGNSIGLLYGQGGYVTKHHSLLLANDAPRAPLPESAIEPVVAAGFDGLIHENYIGEAMVETYTVLFDREGAPRHGIVIAKTPDSGRTIAGVAGHSPAVASLLDPLVPCVGRKGLIESVADGPAQFAFA